MTNEVPRIVKTKRRFKSQFYQISSAFAVPSDRGPAAALPGVWEAPPIPAPLEFERHLALLLPRH